MKRAFLTVLLLAVAGAGAEGRTSAATASACRAHIPGPSYHTLGRFSEADTSLDTVMPDGSFVLGATYEDYHRGHYRVVLHLRRVSPDCQIVASLDTTFPAKRGEIDNVASTPDGHVLLIGGGDSGSYGNLAVVGRFSADLRLDPSFGNHGWVRFLPPGTPPGTDSYADVSSVDVLPSGTIVLGGIESNVGKQCSDRGVITELRPNGGPIRAFGDGGSVLIPNPQCTYIYGEAIDVNPDQSLYALGLHPDICLPPPLVRISAGGSLDSRFDRTVGTAIRHVMPRNSPWLFVPSLAPDGRGGFMLVGGLDRYCGTNGFGPGSGVAMRVAPSGRIVGEKTHFTSPHADGDSSAFDGPPVLRLPSGRLLAAASWGSHALVQVFGPDGSLDDSVGHEGRIRFPNPSGNDGSSSVDLLPAPDGGAWLVTGFPKEFDITPVGVR